MKATRVPNIFTPEFVQSLNDDVLEMLFDLSVERGKSHNEDGTRTPNFDLITKEIDRRYWIRRQAQANELHLTVELLARKESLERTLGERWILKNTCDEQLQAWREELEAINTVSRVRGKLANAYQSGEPVEIPVTLNVDYDDTHKHYTVWYGAEMLWRYSVQYGSDDSRYELKDTLLHDFLDEHHLVIDLSEPVDQLYEIRFFHSLDYDDYRSTDADRARDYLRNGDQYFVGRLNDCVSEVQRIAEYCNVCMRDKGYFEHDLEGNVSGYAYYSQKFGFRYFIRKAVETD